MKKHKKIGSLTIRLTALLVLLLLAVLLMLVATIITQPMIERNADGFRATIGCMALAIVALLDNYVQVIPILKDKEASFEHENLHRLMAHKRSMMGLIIIPVESDTPKFLCGEGAVTDYMHTLLAPFVGLYMKSVLKHGKHALKTTLIAGIVIAWASGLGLGVIPLSIVYSFLIAAYILLTSYLPDLTTTMLLLPHSNKIVYMQARSELLTRKDSTVHILRNNEKVTTPHAVYTSYAKIKVDYYIH